MFVDVGRIDGRNDIFWADGSSQEKPSKEEVIEAIESFNNGKYKVVEFNRIQKDRMMGFWRFSAYVKKVK